MDPKRRGVQTDQTLLPLYISLARCKNESGEKTEGSKKGENALKSSGIANWPT